MFDLSKTYELNEQIHIQYINLNSTIRLFVNTFFCDIPKTAYGVLICTSSNILLNVLFISCLTVCRIRSISTFPHLD